MNTPYSKEDVDNLYRFLGESIWHLQHLEKSLTTFTAMKKLQKLRENGNNFSEEDAHLELKSQQKKTLGPLIKSAKDEEIIDENLIIRFDKFLIERNWIVHKCVINEFLALRNIKAQESSFTRIKNFSQEAINLNNKTCELLNKWFQEKGYDLEKAQVIARNLLENAEKS